MTDFKSKVKNVVKNNFKISKEKYFEFEKKYNFFHNLSVALGNFLNIQPNSTVLDIGCGYGISTNAIKKEFNVSEVIGIDLSDEMINFGKAIYPSLNLMTCDGEEIENIFKNRQFNYIVYNASIFIFPDTLTAFKSAFNLIKKNGYIGFSHYPEIIDTFTGKDLFSHAFEISGFPLPKKRVISDLTTCINNLSKANFKNIITTEYTLRLNTEFLIDFFSIPAQSASLFPKNSYKERVPLIKKLFQNLKQFESKGKISWKIVKAEKL